MSSQVEFKIEHNVALNEIKIIELSAEEIKEIEEARKIGLELSNAEQAEAEAKAIAKAALLAQLGITEEQARLLLS